MTSEFNEARSEFDANSAFSQTANQKKDDHEKKAASDATSAKAREALDRFKANKKKKGIFSFLKEDSDMSSFLEDTIAQTLDRVLRSKGLVSQVKDFTGTIETDWTKVDPAIKNDLLSVKELARQLGSTVGSFDPVASILSVVFNDLAYAETFTKELSNYPEVFGSSIFQIADKRKQIVPQQGNTDFEEGPVVFDREGILVVVAFRNEYISEMTEEQLQEMYDKYSDVEINESIIDDLKHVGGGAYKNLSGETVAVRRGGKLVAKKTKDPSHQVVVGHKIDDEDKV